MTTHPSAPYAHLDRTQYLAQREAQMAALAALAHKWDVEAVGRSYPTDHRRSGGYRYTRAGRWYVVREGVRCAATAAQARALNRVGVSGFASVGPVASSTLDD